MAYSTLTKMQFLNTRIELVTKFIQHDSMADEDKVYSRFNDNNHISVSHKCFMFILTKKSLKF